MADQYSLSRRHVYYLKNKERLQQYSYLYHKATNWKRNKAKIKELEKRKCKELRTNYVVQLLCRRSGGLSYKEIAVHKEMIEAMKALVMLKREIKLYE